jgi:hypothetical protein
MSTPQELLTERKKILDFYNKKYTDSEVIHTFEEKKTIYYRDNKPLDRKMKKVNRKMKQLRKNGDVAFIPGVR